MLHIATIHWKDDRWIDLQLNYLNKYIKASFRTYAFLNDLAADHSKKFHYSSTEPIRQHAVKLNMLADVAINSATSPDDVIIFLDGDAFPVGDIVTFLQGKLPAHGLVAVQRLENNGDIQPHPCFCAITIGLWQEIRGDWRQAPWENPDGTEVCDVGGRLLHRLTEKRIDWYPMRRSNRRERHPLLFGVYDDLVYHHGGGFRDPGATRRDYADLLRRHPLASAIHHRLPRAIGRPLYKIAGYERRLKRRTQALSDSMFERILADELFFHDLIGGPVTTHVIKQRAA